MLAPALKPGDGIAIVAPASTPPRAPMERAVTRLESLGYRVKTYRDLFEPEGYLAGSDSVRAAELNHAFADQEVAMVLAARGGYGVSRLLDQIDYAQVQQTPKIVAGYSDISALHSALQRECNLVTFHSPNAVCGFGHDGDPASELSEQTLLAAATGASLTTSYEQALALKALCPGMAQGRLIGGNAAVVMGLLGTPYEPDFAGAVLFLEDLDEAPYRLDRMLSQLRLAGKLNQLAGVLLGYFTGCEAGEGKPSWPLDQVWRDYFADLGIPVLAGFPAGHERPNLTLPMGAIVEVDAEKRQLKISEPVVQS